MSNKEQLQNEELQQQNANFEAEYIDENVAYVAESKFKSLLLYNKFCMSVILEFGELR